MFRRMLLTTVARKEKNMTPETKLVLWCLWALFVLIGVPISASKKSSKEDSSKEEDDLLDEDFS